MRKVVLTSLALCIGVSLLAAEADTIGDRVAQFLRGLQQRKRSSFSGDAGVAKSDVSLQEGPLVMRPAERGVGHRIAEVTAMDLDGRPVRIAAAHGQTALVIACFSAECPLSAKFAPELARLEKFCAANQMGMVLLDCIKDEPAEAVRGFLTKNALTSRVVLDKDGMVTATLGAKTTTETFVLDAAHTLVYRGAINDQYGLGYQIEAPRHEYLMDALNAVLRDEAPPVAATSAPGCALDAPKPGIAVKTTALTYHNQVSRILNQNCVECHRGNGLAPFSLETFADVTEHAAMIKKQITRGAMPPWFASAPENGESSRWANDRSLTEQDKADLLTWIDSDRKEGNIADAPMPRQFPKEWAIGEPDAIFQIPHPIAVKAEGTMPYQNITVATNLTEDRWVTAYEVLPTDRSVVHHVIVRVVEPGGKLNEREGGGGREDLWAAYVPGNSSRILPEGFAKKLPAGATLHFQIHYTPKGKETQDQVRIGLKFATKEPRYVVHVASVAQPRLLIPPNDPHHVETATRPVPINMMVTGFMPHMHVRGKSFKYELTTPDGKTATLLDVPNYDFNWQLQYRLSKPMFIPRGSTVRITAVYDNSSGNPANPDPNKTVRWGQQTFDEMMLGYVEFFTPNTASKMASN